MAGTHATLSPSSAVRRLLCAGSLAAGKHVADVPTVYAADGTCTHYISSESLLHNAEPHDYVGQAFTFDGFKFTVDDERADRAKIYVDRMRARIGQRMVEVRLDTSNVVGVPGQGGTGDCVILNRAGRQVEVWDLKDGQGIVFAWENPGEGLPRWRGINPQLGEYGASALELADLLGDFDSVLLGIEQPKIGHRDEQVFTRAEIEAWVEWARPREQLAYRLYESGMPLYDLMNAGHLTPDPKACKYCPIKGECPARNAAVLDQFPITAEPGAPTPLAKKSMHELTEADIAYALERVDEIQGWCRDIQSEALRRALASRPIPGWKIVTGREGARSWTDSLKAEEAVVRSVPDNQRYLAYTSPQLLSPTQLEKALKKPHKAVWDALQPLIERKPGSPSLVREYDARAPLQLGAGVEFGIAPVGAEDLL